MGLPNERLERQGSCCDQRSIDTPFADPKSSSDFGAGQPLVIQGLDLGPLVHCRWLPSLVLSRSLGGIDANKLALEHACPLELCKCSEHLDHQLPRGRLGVEGLAIEVQNPQCYRSRLKILDDSEQPADVAGEAIHLGHHEGVAFLQPLQEAVELQGARCPCLSYENLS